jgi:phosphate transport system permease protein
VGAATFVTFDPNGPLARYTVLPVQIYQFIGESREAFIPLAYAAILLLLIILLIMNALAIFLRNKFQQRW